MLRLLMFCFFWPLAGLADGPAPAGVLSDGLRSQILDNAARFEAAVASLILGYGTPKGISAQGVEDYLAVERAKLRVRALRRMLLADLDDDGQVTQEELFVVMSAQGASARGTLWQAHTAADANADGTVTTPEMQAQARTAAAGSSGREAETRAIMQLDFDGDGFVSTLELRHALTLIAPKA